MDIQSYLDRIYAWNPALAGSSVRVDPYGLNNLVVIFDNAWVCRFPRTDESRARLAEEARLLAVVRHDVNVPAPAFETDEILVVNPKTWTGGSVGYDVQAEGSR